MNMKTMLFRIVAVCLLLGTCAALLGCAGGYQPDPTREAKQAEILRFVHSSSEGRGYY